MVVGHAAAALILKPKDNSLPLWALCVAALLTDLVAMVLVLFGVEHMEPTPGLSAVNSMDMYLPYTHSLILTPLWMLGGAMLFKALRPQTSRRNLIIIAVAVASHWILDFISHIPDLPVFMGREPVVGMGLWKNAKATIAVEAVMLAAGLLIFWRTRSVKTTLNKAAFAVLVVILTLITFSVESVPMRETGTQMAITGLFLMGLLFTLAALCEKRAS